MRVFLLPTAGGVRLTCGAGAGAGGGAGVGAGAATCTLGAGDARCAGAFCCLGLGAGRCLAGLEADALGLLRDLGVEPSKESDMVEASGDGSGIISGFGALPMPPRACRRVRRWAVSWERDAETSMRGWDASGALSEGRGAWTGGNLGADELLDGPHVVFLGEPELVPQ